MSTYKDTLPTPLTVLGVDLITVLQFQIKRERLMTNIVIERMNHSLKVDI